MTEVAVINVELAAQLDPLQLQPWSRAASAPFVYVSLSATRWRRHRTVAREA